MRYLITHQPAKVALNAVTCGAVMEAVTLIAAKIAAIAQVIAAVQ